MYMLTCKMTVVFYYRVFFISLIKSFFTDVADGCIFKVFFVIRCHHYRNGFVEYIFYFFVFFVYISEKRLYAIFVASVFSRFS